MESGRREKTEERVEWEGADIASKKTEEKLRECERGVWGDLLKVRKVEVS